jgi:hypothetical protein
MVKQGEIEVKLHFGSYGVVEPKRVRKKAWNKLQSGLDNSRQMWGSVEFLVLVTLKIDLDELTNWFKMSRITPPVELNENMQYILTSLKCVSICSAP